MAASPPTHHQQHRPTPNHHHFSKNHPKHHLRFDHSHKGYPKRFSSQMKIALVLLGLFFISLFFVTFNKKGMSLLPPEPSSPRESGGIFGRAVEYGEPIVGDFAPPYELVGQYVDGGKVLSGDRPFFYVLNDFYPVASDGRETLLTPRAFAPGGLIYNIGYIYTRNAEGVSDWTPFDVVPDEGGSRYRMTDASGAAVDTNWIAVKAKADLPYSSDEFLTAFPEGENYIVTYACLRPNPLEPWKCGCKANSDRPDDCGYWMIQTFDVCSLGKQWDPETNTCNVWTAPGGAGACGDGLLDTGEACDDGNSDAGDGCSEGCAVEAGYECNTDVPPSVCTPVTVAGIAAGEPRCGDGIVNRVEEYCDDGNAVDTDTCTAVCTPALLCADAPASIRALDLHLIADVSLSMARPTEDPRLDQAKRALVGTTAYPLMGFVDKIFAQPNGNRNTISGTRFSGSASQLASKKDITGKSSLESAISLLSLAGGTNYEAGLVRGLQTLCADESSDCATNPDDTDAAVFMTDGAPLVCTTCGVGLSEPNLRHSSGYYSCSSGTSDPLHSLLQTRSRCPLFTKALIENALDKADDFPVKGARLFVIGFDVEQEEADCTAAQQAAALGVHSLPLSDAQVDALAACPRILLKKIAQFGNGEYYTAKTTADASKCDTDPLGTECACSHNPESLECIYGELNTAYSDIASIAACSNICGDGTVDAGEACDDGNRRNSDGCSEACSVEMLGAGVSSAGSLAGQWTLPTQNTAPDNQIVEFSGEGDVYTGILLALGDQIGSFGFSVGETTFRNLQSTGDATYEGEVLVKTVTGSTTTVNWYPVQLTIDGDSMSWTISGVAGESPWQRYTGGADGTVAGETCEIDAATGEIIVNDASSAETERSSPTECITPAVDSQPPFVREHFCTDGVHSMVDGLPCTSGTCTVGSDGAAACVASAASSCTINPNPAVLDGTVQNVCTAADGSVAPANTCLCSTVGDFNRPEPSCLYKAGRLTQSAVPVYGCAADGSCERTARAVCSDGTICDQGLCVAEEAAAAPAAGIVAGEPTIPVCGDKIVSGTEQCDDGMQCDNGVECTSDVRVCDSRISVMTCEQRNFDGCSKECMIEYLSDGDFEGVTLQAFAGYDHAVAAALDNPNKWYEHDRNVPSDEEVTIFESGGNPVVEIQGIGPYVAQAIQVPPGEYTVSGWTNHNGGVIAVQKYDSRKTSVDFIDGVFSFPRFTNSGYNWRKVTGTVTVTDPSGYLVIILETDTADPVLFDSVTVTRG